MIAQVATKPNRPVVFSEGELWLALLDDPRDVLPTIWPVVEPLLTRACEYSNGNFTIESVLKGIFEGRYSLLLLGRAGEDAHAAMVVAVTRLPSGKCVLDCLLVSGTDMDEWTPFESRLDAYGRALGCERVRMIGRKGLAKKLPHWRSVAIVLERVI